MTVFPWLCALLSVSRLMHQISLEMLTDEASLPEKPSPHLNPHDPEDEEDEEAEEEDIAQHGERVQEQHHQDPHA